MPYKPSLKLPDLRDDAPKLALLQRARRDRSERHQGLADQAAEID
jgi:hypothetical protein